MSKQRCRITLSVKKSDDAAAGYWRERIPWYPKTVFGPYRMRGYSRRELVADGVVHAAGCVLGLAAAALLVPRVLVVETPALLACGLALYALSLVTMLFCSATFNMMVRSWTECTRELQLADHLGILLLISGTYTPFLMHACSPRTLAFVWVVGLISFVAKASRSPLDVVQLHVPCFLAMGWACTMTWPAVTATITPWAIRHMFIGGCLYTGGLVPWACNSLEFHNAIWHVCVLAASAMFYSVVYHELALPPSTLCASM
jgi:hemolysin III